MIVTDEKPGASIRKPASRRRIWEEDERLRYEADIQERISLSVTEFLNESQITISALKFFEVSRETLTNVSINSMSLYFTVIPTFIVLNGSNLDGRGHLHVSHDFTSVLLVTAFCSRGGDGGRTTLMSLGDSPK